MDVEPSTPLLYVLRNDLGLHGPHFGCGLGQCGACAVIINGVGDAVVRHAGVDRQGEVTTLEGLAPDGTLHPIQQAWIDEQVPACGFCQNGQIMTAKAMLDRNPESDRRADSRGHERHAVPLHDLLPHPGRHQARREDDVGGKEVPRMTLSTDRRDASSSRRSGMLVVGLAHRGRHRRQRVCRCVRAGGGPYPDPDFRQLDSWIVIKPDNTATFFVGKTDCGQGTGTAFRQMMSDELDIAFEKTDVRDGQHRHHGGPGRIRRIRCHPGRRLADAACRR